MLWLKALASPIETPILRSMSNPSRERGTQTKVLCPCGEVMVLEGIDSNDGHHWELYRCPLFAPGACTIKWRRELEELARSDEPPRSPSGEERSEAGGRKEE